jgi:hypothetical protein
LRGGAVSMIHVAVPPGFARGGPRSLEIRPATGAAAFLYDLEMVTG